jgi:hypothetical protein
VGHSKVPIRYDVQSVEGQQSGGRRATTVADADAATVAAGRYVCVFADVHEKTQQVLVIATHARPGPSTFLDDCQGCFVASAVNVVLGLLALLAHSRSLRRRTRSPAQSARRIA